MKGVLGWLLQRMTGLVLFAGLMTHLYLMHYIGHEQVQYEFVVRRLSDPFWKAFDLVFLLVLIYHGFNGLWGMALEYISSPGILKASKALVLVMAFLLIATGIYIITP